MLVPLYNSYRRKLISFDAKLLHLSITVRILRKVIWHWLHACPLLQREQIEGFKNVILFLKKSRKERKIRGRGGWDGWHRFWWRKSFIHYSTVDKRSLHICIHAWVFFNHKGLKQLRQAICDFHQKYDGFDDLDPEEIVVGPGSKELIYLVMHVFNGGALTLKCKCTLKYFIILSC